MAAPESKHMGAKSPPNLPFPSHLLLTQLLWAGGSTEVEVSPGSYVDRLRTLSGWLFRSSWFPLCLWPLARHSQALMISGNGPASFSTSALGSLQTLTKEP